MSSLITDRTTPQRESLPDPPPRPGDAGWDLEHYTRIGRVLALPFTEADLFDLTEHSLADFD